MANELARGLVRACAALLAQYLTALVFSGVPFDDAFAIAVTAGVLTVIARALVDAAIRMEANYGK